MYCFEWRIIEVIGRWVIQGESRNWPRLVRVEGGIEFVRTSRSRELGMCTLSAGDATETWTPPTGPAARHSVGKSAQDAAAGSFAPVDHFTLRLGMSPLNVTAAQTGFPLGCCIFGPPLFSFSFYDSLPCFLPKQECSF